MIGIPGLLSAKAFQTNRSTPPSFLRGGRYAFPSRIFVFLLSQATAAGKSAGRPFRDGKPKFTVRVF